ncbi:MAG: ExbD/TolR family protein [Akkermansiaceae bacterium]
MKLHRGKMLVDPPACASSDIAFTLIIFFLVCAAVQPETGMSQALPKTESKADKREQSQNIEVSITPSSIILNGSPLKIGEFSRRIQTELSKKTKESDRVVVVKSAPDTPYPTWLEVSQAIDEADGIITLEIETEESINVR